MQLQGKYFIHREVFGKNYSFMVDGSYDQVEDNAIIIDADFLDHARMELQDHLLEYGVKNVLQELFHTVEDISITHRRSFYDNRADLPIVYTRVKATGKALLTKREAESIFQKEQKYADDFVKIAEYRDKVTEYHESIATRKEEQETLQQQIDELQTENKTYSLKISRLEDKIKKGRHVSIKE